MSSSASDQQPAVRGEALPSRAETIRRWAAGGGQIAAVFPVHSPRALLRAFGLLPVEVWGPPGVDPGAGDAHLQSYTCSIVRCGLSFALSGGLHAARLVLVPHACDSLQGLGSILLDFVDLGADRPVLTFYLPRAEGAAALRFVSDELGVLADRLTAITGRCPSRDELLAATLREERADALLAELLAERMRLPWSSRAFYQLARSRQYLPAEQFIERAEAALAVARDPSSAAGRDHGVPLVLSGIVPEPMALLDAIDEAGGVVAGDDLACTGRRLYRAGDSDEPLTRMAQALLAAPPDATRASAVAARATHLIQLAARSSSRAVLFACVKFCEPELFYLPLLRRALQDRGLRSLVVEVDLADTLSDQLVTRIEALVETVAP